MSKSKKQTKKPKTLAEHFRELPSEPTKNHLFSAGCSVLRAMRLGKFKEFENQLLAAFYDGQKKSAIGGEISVWQELIKILRTRANLPYTKDYLGTFAEDCQLVADTLEREAKDLMKTNSKEVEFKDKDKTYTALNLADRIITVGDEEKYISSEIVWDFLKILARAKICFDMDGSYKNAVDMLRRKIGPNNIRKFIEYIEGGYRLNPNVKILYGAQMYIKKTRQLPYTPSANKKKMKRVQCQGCKVFMKVPQGDKPPYYCEDCS